MPNVQSNFKNKLISVSRIINKLKLFLPTGVCTNIRVSETERLRGAGFFHNKQFLLLLLIGYKVYLKTYILQSHKEKNHNS